MYTKYIYIKEMYIHVYRYFGCTNWIEFDLFTASATTPDESSMDTDSCDKSKVDTDSCDKSKVDTDSCDKS